jgi:hypothetical protein
LDRPHLAVFSYSAAAGPREYACPKGGGPLFALAESDPDWRERPFAPSALRIYGSSVGWAVNVPNESTGPAGGCRITLVRRARYFRPGENAHARGWFSPAAIRAGYRANARVGTLVVRPSLSIAWIAFPPYSRRYTIYVAQHNSAFKHEVAAGSRIDPRSLRRHGDRIFWTEAGRRRSAPFPAWGIACRRGKWAASQRFKSEASGPLAKDPLTEG